LTALHRLSVLVFNPKRSENIDLHWLNLVKHQTTMAKSLNSKTPKVRLSQWVVKHQDSTKSASSKTPRFN
jgi:hypothetical protein